MALIGMHWVRHNWMKLRILSLFLWSHGIIVATNIIFIPFNLQIGAGKRCSFFQPGWGTPYLELLPNLAAFVPAIRPYSTTMLRTWAPALPEIW